MENAAQCLNCKSYNVKVWDKRYKLSLAVILGVLGALLYYLGVISSVSILSLGLVVGIGLMVVALFYLFDFFRHKEDMGVCRSCKMKFKISR